ncbi:MAG: hypothetical protein U1B83_01925 [Candidatus Cloacimonadaceae bacterium]|nr:hypothetical protein [Candidatus Cloacimonadaceae bacterium]
MVSPVFESKLGHEGRGLAGFTVYMQDRTFTNHIRYYNADNRSVVIEELNALRNTLINVEQQSAGN